MKHSLTALWILLNFRRTTGLLGTIECPEYSQTDVLQFHELDFPSLDCTLRISHNDPLESHAENSHDGSTCLGENKFHDDDFLFDCLTNKAQTCSIKLKITTIKNWEFESSTENPCPTYQDSLGQTLLPVAGNCSMFYKCDWGSAVLFECPSELHFNAELQVCDWPWKAQCDPSWNGCPRPYPKCPVNYPRPLYLPHPQVCDKFYQCDWGISHLQTCPTGLHFNPQLKTCDWPHRVNCQVC